MCCSAKNYIVRQRNDTQGAGVRWTPRQRRSTDRAGRRDYSLRKTIIYKKQNVITRHGCAEVIRTPKRRRIATPITIHLIRQSKIDTFLTCRLGRCFCYAKVSTGYPHPKGEGMARNDDGERIATRLPPFAMTTKNLKLYRSPTDARILCVVP